MASEDVIHDFFVPAFRVKMDVVPAITTPCGSAPPSPAVIISSVAVLRSNHALMGGWVTVMEPSEYAAWLSGSSGQGDPAVAGEKLFVERACSTCHFPDGTGRAPSLTACTAPK